MSGGVKQSLYFPEDMLAEMQREAKRQDRSLSWIVQQAWRVARKDLRKIPSANDVIEMRQDRGS
ncbi:MAG: TIGR04563 family protein [Deltaproteobacteria bacterium]|nr:TIGR04563 family protein [Deltaproteobacteria bacterium]MCB9654543.1 TIGR04563 family protein [Deltaproteobacteria bacterium]